MKRFLIFTVTAGNGHNSAANAVKEELENRGTEVKVVDLLHEFCDNKTFIWVQEKGYSIAVSHFNSIYDAFFKHFQKADPKNYYKSPVQSGLKSFYDKVLKCIYDYRPDAIFCSHFLPCAMISNLRKLYQIPCPVYSFVFDYDVCPFWEACTGIDKLLIPNETYIPIMLAKGFKSEQLLSYGLTVNEKFSQHIDKADARERLGLKNDVFTILVMFGGGFWSGNYKIVKNIFKNMTSHTLQVIVANGRNKKSKQQIDELKVPSNITLLNSGFSKQVDLFMSASDVIVGKAGGVSVTESLNKFLPMVCCNDLPQQERTNVDMLVREGAAKQYKTDKQLIEILTMLADDPKHLIEMRKNIARIRRPNATQMLADEMMKSETTYMVDTSKVDYSLVNKEIRKLLHHKGQIT